MPTEFLVTVAGMAVILFASRIGGYLLIRRVPMTPILEAWLGYLPGATLVALIAPMVVHSGTVGIIAGAVVLGIMLRTDNIIVAMAIGVAIVGVFG